MNVLNASRRRIGIALVSAFVVVGGGLAIAAASSNTPATPSNGGGHGRGMNQFGLTHAYYKGHKLKLRYDKGYYCDTSVHATATSKCEAGAKWNKPPAKHFDPLYITVPLGFNRPAMSMQCPNGLVCVDHPGTIDLRRLEPALKPLYPDLSKKQLLKALSNFPVPGHDHFITDTNNNKDEWWPTYVVGVTSKKLFNSIREHGSYAFIQHLLKNKNKNVVGPIPTNLFLFFSVH
jgi:hypothetical protein